MSISIHRAQPADWPRIRPIWPEIIASCDTYTYTYAYGPAPSCGSARASWGGGQPDHETWPAETDGAVLGLDDAEQLT